MPSSRFPNLRCAGNLPAVMRPDAAAVRTATAIQALAADGTRSGSSMQSSYRIDARRSAPGKPAPGHRTGREPRRPMGHALPTRPLEPVAVEDFLDDWSAPEAQATLHALVERLRSKKPGWSFAQPRVIGSHSRWPTGLYRLTPETAGATIPATRPNRGRTDVRTQRKWLAA